MKLKLLLILLLFVSADLFAVITKWQDVEIVNGREYISVGAHGKSRSYVIKEIDVTTFGRPGGYFNR